MSPVTRDGLGIQGRGNRDAECPQRMHCYGLKEGSHGNSDGRRGYRTETRAQEEAGAGTGMQPGVRAWNMEVFHVRSCICAYGFGCGVC